MGTNAGNILTLANSIIGVSVLAMPFCFKQCGILLSILMLLFSSMISRLACYFLMKSALLEKRKNFEMLAFRVYGPTGKLMVELCIIGFMLGTCVAFFVIMGDLGPAILAQPLGIDHPSALRPSVLIGVAVFVVLPLGLLRNVDSLNAICAASILFYVCLVLKVLSEATTNIISWSWIDKVYLWRPSGILQCIPIFSMALSCQTQLFEIFDGFLNTPLDRMNAVVRAAINMTTIFYISVGLFGYIAYCNQSFTGNVMMNFSPTLWSEVIKIGFVLSVAVSFPLVIFPCRASIHSLLFSKSGHGYELVGGSSHIPETRFQCITLVIVTSSLVVGLVMPNIEVVLGLVGSTIGVFICVITPGIIFSSLSTKNTSERLIAQVLVGVGLVIMVLGTYANLSATEEAVRESHLSDIRSEMKLNPPVISSLVTELPDKEAVNFMNDDKVKEDLSDSNKFKLPQEPKLDEALIVEKNDAKEILPPLNPPVIAHPERKEVKINDKDKVRAEVIKEPIVLANINNKIEDKAPPVANPEPPPKEIPKAIPIIPLVPNLPGPRAVDPPLPLLKEVKSKLSSTNQILKKESIALNISGNNNKVKDLKISLNDGTIEKKNVQDQQRELMEKNAIRENKEAIPDKVDLTKKKPVDNLAMSMAQGVPLPLAVKGVKPSEEKNKEKIKIAAEISSNELVKEKKSAVERGLLEKVEAREKRDTEMEIKNEIEEKVVEKEEHHHPLTAQEENSKETAAKSSEDTPSTAAPPIVLKNDDENCPRPNGKAPVDAESKGVDNKTPKPSSAVQQQQSQEESLIKTPVRLTNPETDLDTDPKLLAENQLQGNNVMPKTRDLKSLNRKDDK